MVLIMQDFGDHGKNLGFMQGCLLMTKQFCLIFKNNFSLPFPIVATLVLRFPCIFSVLLSLANWQLISVAVS